MDGLIELLILLLIGVVIGLLVMPIVAIVKAGAVKRSAEELDRRLSALEREVRTLRQQGSGMGGQEPERAGPASPAPFARTPEVSRPTQTRTGTPTEEPAPAPPAPVPPAPAPRAPAPQWTPPVVIPVPEAPAHSSGPSSEFEEALGISEMKHDRPSAPIKTSIEWEKFMGAQLFSWVGGLALFLGVAFFVKYSFEHNLIPPEVRVAIGFLVGIGLLAGGVLLKRKANAVTAQTLCAAGVLILYAVTFSCRSYYHFAFFGLVPTFLLMTLITAVAFLLAVRLDALVVAILGIAGGFLTPVLLSTGEDSPLALFGYIALLDIGLLTVAQRKRWSALPILGATGTVLMQAAWVAQFFVSQRYFDDNKVLVAMAVFAGFEALFLAALAWANHAAKPSRALVAAGLALCSTAMIAGFYFLSFQGLAHRPVLLFSYVFLADLGLLALPFIEAGLSIAAAAGGVVIFIFLSLWTDEYLRTGNLYAALGFYFLFALLHSAGPIALQRLRKIRVPIWCHAFPALALVLALLPILRLSELSILIWPFVLFVDVIALLLAVVTATLLPILMVLVLTLVVVGAWLFRIPSEMTGLSTGLFLLGGFAIFFLLAAAWACRRLAAGQGGSVTGARTAKLFGGMTDPANFAVQLPALSATLPFLLLIMVTLRLPLANPSPVFGLALVLTVLLLGMTKILALDALPAVGLASVLALEHAWHFHRFDPANAALPLAWYLLFYAVFTVFPFLFHRRFETKSVPWAASALAGPLHFYLIYRLVQLAYPTPVPGLLPAAFSVPALLGLFTLLKRTPSESPARNAQLAFFGGVALFFITLIFPIQFDRQWITVGWALEGAALCWFFHRVPHPGLRLAGAGLLMVSFARLALNPAVLSYHPRTATPIFNWYLYSYGIVTACLFVGAYLLAPPRNRVLEWNMPPCLYTLGTVLAFLLVNIEIADYFTPPHVSALTFQFSGNFARDMSYSIAWALFALLLLVIGIQKREAAVRYASIGLLGVTLLKLFLHDLSQLQQLYRIAALIVVAVIAMLASFLYQRFLGAAEKANPRGDL